MSVRPGHFPISFQTKPILHVKFFLKNLMYVALLALAFALVGCSNAKYEGGSGSTADKTASMEEGTAAMPTETAEESGAELNEASPQSAERKIIYTGNIALRVADLQAAEEELLALVKSHNGYIGSENLFNSYTKELSVRVPAGGFQAFTRKLEEIGEYVLSKSLQARDVTAQFVDLEARLKVKRAAEERYVQLLQKAQNVGEVLEVEDKLRKIREEIERAEGQLRYLKNQVAFSTLTIRLEEKAPSVANPEESFGSRVGRALKNGWQGLMSFFIVIISAWPFWLIMAGVGWLVLRWRKKRRARKKSQKQQQ